MVTKDPKRLVEMYFIDTQDLSISGIEFLETLSIRDRIEKVKSELDNATKLQLQVADRALYMKVCEVYKEVNRFINFENSRLQRNIPPSHWWWYLDVCNYMWNDVND